MGIKKYNPATPSRRWITQSDFAEITKDKPEKSLLLPLKRTGGRNAYGRITTRHQGGGHKRMMRIVDFKRDILDVPAKVIAIEYDPNRSARLALLEYPDKTRKYILAPLELKAGSEIISSSNKDTEIKAGNCLPLRFIPQGTLVHNIELSQGRGGQIVRSAGSYAQIMAKEGDFAHLKLPSAEIRLVSLDCRATIGQLGNVEHEALAIGKAGRNRWFGIRPTVRGLAMNPVDHPHGGGEGRQPIGLKHPKTPWGKPALGVKTRNRKKWSNKLIIQRRKK